MKKLVSIALSLGIVANLTAVTAFASENITAELDGKVISFDVAPKIVDGRAMVPLRKIFEEIGANVKWNEETRTVSARKNKKTINLTIDSQELQIDKGKTDDEGNLIVETVALDAPAQIYDGRTLVPIRAVSESFGLDVKWDEENRKIVITSEDEKDEAWKENVGSINLTDLTYEGEGIEINGNQIKITSGGDFALTGTLDDGNITISTKERVKLRLSGAKITSSEDPCIFVEKADKAFITVSDGTENYLTAKKSDDGAIYSKENLEIKGDGVLNIDSLAGHGMKASDNLNIENGTININATTDGIHINDTFKMTGGTLNITSVCDGIDCESIINISGGAINIETTAVPIEPEKPTEETTQEAPRRFMWEEAQSVEFEKSSKGINAEWMLTIADGDININSASHAIHCQDEMVISGGKFTIASKYDKGISAHGNLTISGEQTLIDISKATEGIESKNVLTINDGVINITSTDDAINATGGSTGMMGMPRNNGDNTNGGNTNGGNNRQTPQGNRNPNAAANAKGEAQQGTQNPEMNRPRWNGNMPAEVIPPENGEFTMPENRQFAPRENVQFTPPADGQFTPPQNAGAMMGGFAMGRRANMKTCLIVNGGKFEFTAGDDGLDANGNMIINGGTIKATNPTGAFTGNFGIIDADGQTTVGEKANLVLAAVSGNEKSLNLTQNVIVIYCENEHGAEDKITVSDSSGNVVYEYTPGGKYKAVLIASENIKTGEKYAITVGGENFEAEISAQSTIVGTQPVNSGRGFGGWQPR